jgi:hypothetical protein
MNERTWFASLKREDKKIKKAVADQLKEIKRETNPYKRTLVLDGSGKLKLFLDVIDGKDDFYYKVINQYTGEVEHHSCVGAIIFLAGKISKWDYNYLARSWNYRNEAKIQLIRTRFGGK